VSTVLQGIVASMGMPTYRDWVNGKIKTANDPNVMQAFETLKKYLSYANADSTKIHWTEALKRVRQGEGAFFIMGDWAEGECKRSGMKWGREYGTIPVPGTAGLYSVTIDAFVRSHAAEHPA